jgi:hypothetical protein
MNLTDGSSHHCVRTSIILGDQASFYSDNDSVKRLPPTKTVKHAMKYADKRELYDCMIRKRIGMD